MIIPKPTQDEIDQRFDLAVKLEKEHLLSKTGEMYPFNPDNLQEAVAEMSEEQKVVFAAFTEEVNTFSLSSWLRQYSRDYWEQCADKKALEVVQKNFDPLNMR
jgi:hypothetical protein